MKKLKVSLYKEMFSIILPLKAVQSIFKEIVLPSYKKYLSAEYLKTFFIISPEKEILKISEAVKDLQFPFSIISEETILQKNTLLFKGWFKQQIIKLAIVSLIETEIYLVLDGDMFLTQPFSFRDLQTQNRKLPYHSEPWQEINGSLFSQNSNWWKNSAKILDYDINLLKTEKDLMCVTPQILIGQQVKNLLSEIKQKYSEETYQKELCEREFTEFTLYWIYILKNNLKHLYSDNVKTLLWKHDIERNIITPSYTIQGIHPVTKIIETYSVFDSDHLVKIMKRVVIDPKTFFCVMQSYNFENNLDAEEYIVTEFKKIESENTVKKHLEDHFGPMFKHEIAFCPNLFVVDENTFNKETRPKYDAIFLVPSTISPSSQKAFTSEERLLQTLETIKSIKKYVPNSFIILIEGSRTLKENWKTHVNKVLYAETQDFPYIDHYNVGCGEMKLLEKGINYILENNLEADYIIKIAGRYYLTDKFKLENYDKNKYTFLERWDESASFKVFITCLYSIPKEKLKEFKKILIKSQDLLNTRYNMIECLFYDIIPPSERLAIPVLGMEGQRSYDGKVVVM